MTITSNAVLIGLAFRLNHTHQLVIGSRHSLVIGSVHRIPAIDRQHLRHLQTLKPHIISVILYVTIIMCKMVITQMPNRYNGSDLCRTSDPAPAPAQGSARSHTNSLLQLFFPKSIFIFSSHQTIEFQVVFSSKLKSQMKCSFVSYGRKTDEKIH